MVAWVRPLENWVRPLEARELPHPAMILLDDQGIVQWFYIGEDYKTRPSATQLQQVLDRLES